jgi:hypothetical protein
MICECAALNLCLVVYRPHNWSVTLDHNRGVMDVISRLL